MSIELINASIELKKNNGVMGYNFYEWIQEARKELFPYSTLLEVWEKITSSASKEL